MKFGFKALLAEAIVSIRSISPQAAAALREDSVVLMVDVRDIRELLRDGMIPDAFHAPRGMLEFWIDEESPYFKAQFSSCKTLIFYCASGWRSALATLAVQRMGLQSVLNLEGGFTAWRKAGLPSLSSEVVRQTLGKTVLEAIKSGG